MSETWQSLADDAYRASLSLRQERRCRSAISRAYYAVYSRVTALLVAHGVTMPDDYEGPLHSKLAALIEAHLTGLRSKRWTVAGLARGLYDLRVIADYHPSVPVDGGDALVAVRRMMGAFHLLAGEKP